MGDWLPWLLIVAAAIAGHRAGTKRPRRRLYMNTVTGRSVIPAGAHPQPGDDECVGLGHQLLSWAENVERRHGGTMRRIVEAHCGDCGRPQARIRLVYPPERRLEVNQPKPPTPGGDRLSASTGSAEQRQRPVS